MTFVCRPAREEDYEAVVNIDRDVFDGLDYVPARFNFYLSSPNHYPFVLEMNGEIVGFMYKYVVDDGTAVVGAGGRARADLRGNGLVTRKLGEYAHNEMLRLRPSAAHRRLYTAADSPVQDNLIKTGKAKILLHRALEPYVTTTDSVRRYVRGFRFKVLTRKYNVEHVCMPDREEFVKLMMASPELFPGNCFVAFGEPYRPMVANFNYVAANLICQLTPSKHGHKASAVSFTFHVPCKSGLRLDMEFYGTDINQMIQHLLKSLEYLSTLDFEGDIYYTMFFPLEFNRRQLQEFTQTNLLWKLGSFLDCHSYFSAEYKPKNDAKL